jgi:hypothetical protein
MLALSGLREGFARGVFSFHPAPLYTCPEKSLSPIIPALARRVRKSNHSRTYGIAGGGRCTGFFVRPIHRASKPLFPLHTKFLLTTLLFPLLTQKQGGVPTRKNVGAPTFLIFSLIFRTFCPSRVQNITEERKRGAGLPPLSGQVKDRRLRWENQARVEASKAWPSARTLSGTRRSSRTRRNQERSFRP